MLKYKLIGLAVALHSMLVNTFHPVPEPFARNHGEYQKMALGSMKGFTESSGLEIYQDSLLITHNDGDDNALFISDFKGTITDTLNLKANNQDWEDITQDDSGNYYIGDFGNNSNSRKNLVIYKYNPLLDDMAEIRFSFNDQQSFPPEKQEMNFDVEAMCWFGGQIHLFSKNRGKKCVNHYILPDKAGEYSVDPVESIYLPNLITGADTNNANNLLALSSYGRVYLFKLSAEGSFFSQGYKAIKFVRGAQTEAITFINNTDFVTSNESGKLFLFEKRK